jgi:anti-sigma regulatory factor (Ser/Thr protein kinase)
LPWSVDVPAFAEPDGSGSLSSELCLPAQRTQLAGARRFVAQTAAGFGLDSDGCYEFAYAVNEAVTNAIRHGRPDGRGLIHISITADDGWITCSVRDYGTFVSPSLDPPAGSARPIENGRGFALMKSLVDDVQLEVAPGRTIVRLSKARP